MVITVGNSGFAFILLIEDADGVQPELLRPLPCLRDAA